MAESFFQFRSRQQGGRTSQGTTIDAGSSGVNPLSVAELTASIDAALRKQLPAAILVKGEISNLNHHRASGHLYFTMKDDKSCIDCVMFKTDVARMPVIPADGDEVLATGGVRVYAQRGRYQLYVTAMMPLGKGALEARFQQLRLKLEAEGLFDPQRKRELPRYPQSIALVTSRQAAALQDMLKVFARYPWLDIAVHHVPVQGAGSAAQIAEMLAKVNGAKSPPDLIILGRGGGSLEDLWEFNEEAVARAVVASRIPVITGIGHEVDVSIADLAADYHAHTPTEAAQVAVAHWKLAQNFIEGAAVRLNRGLKNQLDDARRRLGAIERHEFFRRPTDSINRWRQALDDRERQLTSALKSLMTRQRTRLFRADSRLAGRHPRAIVAVEAQRLKSLGLVLEQSHRATIQSHKHQIEIIEKQLAALHPYGVLARGYSITTLKKTGQVLRRAADVRPGDTLVTQFADGTTESVAKDTKQGELF